MLTGLTSVCEAKKKKKLRGGKWWSSLDLDLILKRKKSPIKLLIDEFC